MDYTHVEAEIDCLESLLGNLESARIDAMESSYHQYIANSLELDIEDIKTRLDELYAIQDNYWTKEMQEQNRQYEEARL